MTAPVEITPGTVVRVPAVDQVYVASSPEKAIEIVQGLQAKGHDAYIMEPSPPTSAEEVETNLRAWEQRSGGDV